MKHAFLITAYKNPDQILHLIRRMEGPGHYFFVHFDRKSELSKHPAFRSLRLRSDTTVYSMYRVNWGGLSHLKALLALMDIALGSSDYEYFHTMSGQCYPTVSQTEFDDFFISNNGSEFIECVELPSAHWSEGGIDRFILYHLNDFVDVRKRPFTYINRALLSLQMKLGKRRPIPHWLKKIYWGSTWVSLSRVAVKYIVDFTERNENCIASLKYTFCSEEIFFHTILMNSPIRNRIISDSLRYIQWNPRNGKCPADLDDRDYKHIIRSGKLLVRKMEPGLSDGLRARLDRRIERLKE